MRHVGQGQEVGPQYRCLQVVENRRRGRYTVLRMLKHPGLPDISERFSSSCVIFPRFLNAWETWLASACHRGNEAMLRDPYRVASLIVVVGGIGMLIAGSIFAFSFVQGPRYAIDGYQIDQSVVENGITLAVRRVFYRAGYRTGYQLVRDKKREEVLVEGYIGNSTDKPVRFFVFEQIGSGPRNGLVTFRWDRGVRDKIIDTPFVGGSLRPRLSEQGEAIRSPANPRKAVGDSLRDRRHRRHILGDPSR